MHHTTFLSFALLSLTTLVSSAPTNSSKPCNSPDCYRYYNNQTKPFFVEKWPLVHFPTGEFYAGNVPINASDPSRSLFFVFKPATNVDPVNETTIWFNGGPGCSSLAGFLQENGPISWQPGTLKPTENPYAWSTITNMLWVEYPVGVGFTTGKITANNEVETARDFVGFLKNWQRLFGIENYKTYVTGESYAGRYVPYVAAEMLNQNDQTYFNVAGALIYDPTIGMYTTVQTNTPAYRFVRDNNEIFNFNQSFMASLEATSVKCGLEAYMDKYLQFPPPGLQPVIDGNQPKASCSVYGEFQTEWLNLNPCLNPYEITQECPIPNDPLAIHPHERPQAYFNRPDVREAIHAPANFQHGKKVGEVLNTNWLECGDYANAPFKGPYHSKGGPEGSTDLSPDPAQAVLPQVIEATNRVLIGNGDFDSVIITNGTLLAIQNMTWNGALGFQQTPSKPYSVPGQGVLGTQHFERGLMWVESFATGHMEPEFQPRATLLHLQWLLGMIDEL